MGHRSLLEESDVFFLVVPGKYAPCKGKRVVTLTKRIMIHTPVE